MSRKSISILYLSFGSGHQIAAESLADSLRSAAPDIPIITEDPFSNSIAWLPSLLAGLQAATIVMAPDLYEFAWRRAPTRNNPARDPVLLQNFLLGQLGDHNSNVIVSTHVVPCALVSGLKKSNRLGRSTRVFGVITDYGLNSIWPIDHMDGYFVAHEELRSALVYRGVDPGTIHVTGIPIKPKFGLASVTSSSHRLRVLMIAGGMRSGGYVMLKKYVMEVLNTLIALNEPRLQITVVTGNQTRLKSDLERLVDGCPYELEIKGYVNNMEALMAVHDILITKPGGLTIAEALASGMPLIVSRPAPGVESANVDFLSRHGIALRGETAADVVRALQFCLENPGALRGMRSAAGRLGFPNSAEVVADHILKT